MGWNDVELGCFILSPAYLIQLNYYKKLYLKLVSKLVMATAWSSGICTLDTCTCCLACWCPCVVIYRNVAKMDITKFPTIPCVYKCGSFDRPSVAACMYAIGFWGGIAFRSIDPLFFVLGILAVCTHYNIRHSIRDELNIHSDCCCEDLWCSIFCYSCAMTQEYKQLNEISSGQPTAPNSMNTPILPKDVQLTRP